MPKKSRMVQKTKMRLRQKWQMANAMDPTLKPRVIHRTVAVALLALGYFLHFPALGVLFAGFAFARGGSAAEWAPAWKANLTGILSLVRDDREVLLLGMTEADQNPAAWRAPGPPSGLWARLGRLSGWNALLLALLSSAIPQTGSPVWALVGHLTTPLAVYLLLQTRAAAKSAGTYTRSPILSPSTLASPHGEGTLASYAKSLVARGVFASIILVVLALIASPSILFGILTSFYALLLTGLWALWRFTKAYAEVDLVWANYLTSRASWWAAAWAPLLKSTAIPPTFLSMDVRPTADAPSYEVATFTLPPGSSLSTFEALGSTLGESSLSTKFVLVSEAHQPGPGGAPTGALIPGQFSVRYGVAALGDDAHLRRYGLDLPRRTERAVRMKNQEALEVGRFVYESALRRAFAACKLGTPALTSFRHLYSPEASEAAYDDQLLVEISVKLPQGVTTEMVVKKQAALQEALSAPFLALGRKVSEDGLGGEAVSDELSLVYGESPTSLELSEEALLWVERLAWDERLRALRLASLAGLAPRLTSLTKNEDTLHTLTFSLVPGVTVESFRLAAAKLAEVLRVEHLTVTKGEAGNVVVSYLTASAGEEPLRHTLCEDETRRFLVSSVLSRVFTATKLGAPTLLSLSDLVEPDAALLMDTEWALPEGVSFEDAARVAEKLNSGIPFSFVRLSTTSSGCLRLVMGDNPDSLTLSDESRLVVDGLDWERHFRSCKLVGFDGSAPRILSHTLTVQGLDNWVFQTAPGLEVEVVRLGQKTLKDTTRLPFLMVESIDEVGGSSGRIRIVTGPKDPLDEGYRFLDHADITLLPPGDKPNLSWAVGMGVEGQPLYFSFTEADPPHLLIAGGTGSGKSTILASMLSQLIHNNRAEDQLALWLYDPKAVELPIFKNTKHCQRWFDPTMGETAYDVANILFEDLEAEMDRRNALLSEMGVKKLSEARARLTREEIIEKDLRYIIVCIDECADLYVPPAASKDRVAAETTRALASKIARKSRSSGIYLVQLTQYPTDRSIPYDVKTNTSRIGLGTATQMASMVILDAPGLEDIKTKGRGLMLQGTNLRGYRSFYFIAPNEDDPGSQDDLRDVVTLFDSEEGRTFDSAGSAKTFTPPPIPDDIWNGA